MTEDVNPVPIARGHRRVPTKNLTDGEKEELTEQGFDVENDFVDIPTSTAKPAAPKDAAGAERQEAIK